MNLARQMKHDGLRAERQARIGRRHTRASASAGFDGARGLIPAGAQQAPAMTPKDNAKDRAMNEIDSKPQPTPADQIETMHADEFAGQGGSYEIRDGKRVLVERTAQPGEATQSEPVPPVSTVPLA